MQWHPFSLMTERTAVTKSLWQEEWWGKQRKAWRNDQVSCKEECWGQCVEWNPISVFIHLNVILYCNLIQKERAHLHKSFYPVEIISVHCLGISVKLDNGFVYSGVWDVWHHRQHKHLLFEDQAFLQYLLLALLFIQLQKVLHTGASAGES